MFPATLLVCLRESMTLSMLLHLQYPEFGLQALITVLMLCTGRWLVGGLQLVVLAFNLRLVFLQQYRVDVTGGTAGRGHAPASVCGALSLPCRMPSQ